MSRNDALCLGGSRWKPCIWDPSSSRRSLSTACSKRLRYNRARPPMGQEDTSHSNGLHPFGEDAPAPSGERDLGRGEDGNQVTPSEARHDGQWLPHRRHPMYCGLYVVHEAHQRDRRRASRDPAPAGSCLRMTLAAETCGSPGTGGGAVSPALVRISEDRPEGTTILQKMCRWAAPGM